MFYPKSIDPDLYDVLFEVVFISPIDETIQKGRFVNEPPLD